MQDPRINTMKTDTVTTGASTVKSGLTEDTGSAAAHAATHAVESADGKCDIDRRNASSMSGVTKKSAPAATMEESGCTRSAHSSSTARVRGWNDSQLLMTSRSAPPGGSEIGDHRCSRGSNPARSARSVTSRGSDQTGSPDHRSGESRGYAASNKPKNTTFGSSNR